MAEENKLPATKADGPTPQPEPRIWYKRMSLAVSAFIMSLTITLINAFHAMEGAEIVVLPPDQVILYRDGTGDAAVLAFTIRLPMINEASSYGDVMLKAAVRPRPDGPAFDYQALVQPVFTDNPNAAANCPTGARCVPLPGLVMIERADEIVDVAGGSATARYFSFPAAEWNCEGAQPACARFGGFEAAVRAIGGRPLHLRFTLQFHGDGEREISCRSAPMDMNYLRKIGWIAASCEQNDVTGAPFL